MISDEPDEDAEEFDDDTILESLVGHDGIGRLDVPQRSLMPEWPAGGDRGIDLQVDAETMAWFRSSHPDWQRQMGLVLRAWMIANTASDTPGISPPSAADPS